MQSNKKSLSFFSLWIFIFLCFISIISALFIAISFSDSLNEENYTIEGLGIADYNSTSSAFANNVIVFMVTLASPRSI